MTGDELNACANRVLEDAEVTGRRGRRELALIQEFKSLFITEILLAQMKKRNEERRRD